MQPMIFGPYFGEFGWHVRAWAPHVCARVRRMRSAGDDRKVIILSPSGTRSLYQPLDRFDDIEHQAHKAGATPSEFMGLHCGGCEYLGVRLVRARGLDAAGIYQPKQGQAFAESCLQDLMKHDYGIPSAQPKNVHIAFCKRERHDLAQHRNYGQWSDLMHRLHRFSHWAARKDSAAAALDSMKRARVVIGESSGGMHLAITAGIPIVCWGEPKNAVRYCEQDNWHGVPVRFIAQLQPPPELIVQQVRELLESMEGSCKTS